MAVLPGVGNRWCVSERSFPRIEMHAFGYKLLSTAERDNTDSWSFVLDAEAR